MTIFQFYLSDETRHREAEFLTGLTIKEIEEIVGRFSSEHTERPNKLKGQIIVTSKGVVKICHHFTKKKLWSCEIDLVKSLFVVDSVCGTNFIPK